MAELKKELTCLDSMAIITAIVVGVGIFRVPAEIAGLLPSPFFMLLAWLLGGIISMFGALCYAELSASFPESGGNYVYFRKSYGEGCAFLFGWSEFLVIRTGSIAAVAFIASEYLCSLLALDAIFIKPAAIFIIALLSVINILGLGPGKKIHNLFTASTILALVGIIVSGLFAQKGSIEHFQAVSLGLDRHTFSLLALALIPVLWTYGGWHENTFVARETKDAGKTLPRALIGGVALVTFLYLAVNAFYIYLIPTEEIAGLALIGSEVFYLLHGSRGKAIFETVVVMASLGSINAMLITGSRITHAMAKDNNAIKGLEKVDGRSGSPRRAIIVNSVWASVLIVLGTFSELLFFTGILAWLFFGLAGLSLFILRKKYPHRKRPYKVWGFPIIPTVFIAICGVLFLNTLINNPVPSLFGIGILLSGIPVYLLLKRSRKEEVS